LYQIAVEFLNKKSIEIQQSNILFYHNVLRLPVKQGTLPQSTCDFYYVIGNLTLLGDQYLDRVIGLGIDFSEQIHRDIAIPQGARDLTWSYSSFVTAFRTREYLKKIIPTTDCL
jgi:hypothetical protein